jgi:Inositol hexakisphosphate
MRQEPVVYINGNPYCARPPNKIGEYAELGDVTRESVKKDENEFIKVIEGRAKGADGKIKYFDVNKKEGEVEVKELTTLSLVIESLKEKFPGLVHVRIPICNSASPTESDFDTICTALQGSAVNCPVIVNCQASILHKTSCSFLLLQGS